MGWCERRHPCALSSQAGLPSSLTPFSSSLTPFSDTLPSLNFADTSLQSQDPAAPFAAPIPWRRRGIRHAQNEIFFDVEETLDAVVDRQGRVLTSSVWGRIGANSKLSGIPDLLLSFANTQVMKECAFHPCIRYRKWERDHVLSFIPPDGKFKLLEYEAATTPQLPISLKASVKVEDTGGKCCIACIADGRSLLSDSAIASIHPAIRGHCRVHLPGLLHSQRQRYTFRRPTAARTHSPGRCL